MRISGGAQFNYLAFLNSSQPLYLPDEIKTEYAYINEYDIIQNGRILTEIEFLEIIGLSEAVEEIRSNFIQMVEEYNNKVAQYNKAVEHYENNLSIGQLVLNPLSTGFCILGWSSTFIGLWMYVEINSDISKTFDFDKKKAGYQKPPFNILVGIGIISLASSYLSSLKYEALEKNNPKPYNYISKPVLKQKYTNKQLKSLAESYNKRIYEEIKNSK